MNPAALVIAALALMGAGILGKNKIQDASVVNSGSFTRWDELFRRFGAQYGVPWWQLKAICMVESDLGEAPSVARGLASPNDIEGSKSSDGKSWGLMQMTLPTLKDYDGAGTAQKLNDPIYSIRYAAQHLRSLRRQFPIVDTRYEEWVVKSYNQGAGNTAKEMSGASRGFAAEYWSRYQRKKNLIESKQGLK